MPRPKRSEIQKSLEVQLKAKGADIACFRDLINDYMSLWDIKNKLAADINERGIVYNDLSSVGVPIKKNNPSVKEIVNVNRQMLSILEKLGLDTKSAVGGSGGDADGDM